MAKHPVKIKVAIVDDHVLLREGIRARLEGEPDIEIVGEGDTGLAALEICKTFAPDVLLLDISMPEMNGLDAASLLQDTGSNTRILIISVFDDAEYVQEALRIGASGFILKDVSKPEMIRAIHKVAEGGIYLGKKLSPLGKSEIDDRKTVAKSYNLTEREKQVLVKIAQGMQNKQIAYALSISVRTVESHRSSIREKTGGGNAAALALIARDLELL